MRRRKPADGKDAGGCFGLSRGGIPPHICHRQLGEVREVSQASIVLLPYTPSSVSTARWHLVADLRSAGVCPQSACDAALVVSELLSNALIHATPLPGRWIEVSWAVAQESVEVAVRDGGSTTLPHPAFPSLSSVGGRGLSIVDQLASRWGVRSSEVGTTVWAVLPAPGGADGSGRHFWPGHCDGDGKARARRRQAAHSN